MGISTYQSYCGAQIFDAVGLSKRLRRSLLLRHATRIEASTWEIAEETARRHDEAFGESQVLRDGAGGRRRIRLQPARRGPLLDAGNGALLSTPARGNAGESPAYAKLLNDRTSAS